MFGCMDQKLYEKINYENNDSISNYCNNLGFILENKGSMASSKIKSKKIFIAILIINSLGVFPIYYLYKKLF